MLSITHIRWPRVAALALVVATTTFALAATSSSAAVPATATDAPADPMANPPAPTEANSSAPPPPSSVVDTAASTVAPTTAPPPESAPPSEPPTETAPPTSAAADVETTTVADEQTTTSAAPTTTAAVVPLALDAFAIGYGTTVSDGSPGAGAGNIESGGDEDAYTFEAAAGDDVVLDVLAGGAGSFRWRLVAPDGAELFDGLYVDQRRVLPTSGSYTVTVYGATAATTGTYSFALLQAPPAEQFTIAFGDTVSDGVPAAGAGNLEAPAAVDVYTFDGGMGQQAILDVLSGDNVFIRWSLVAPDGSELVDAPIGDRAVTLPQDGSYTLSVQGNGIDDTGTYSFSLLGAPAADEFAIAFGDTVSDGLPAAGAGNLERPGAADVYRFDAVAGQVAIFDALVGNPGVFHWSLTAPDGAVLFDVFFVDQQVSLPQDGSYTVTVSGQQAVSTGTYSFSLNAAPTASDEFTIDFGDSISDGVPGPGAGNLESPGSLDVYRFDATAGQVALFDAVSGSATSFHWSLAAPDGAVLFDVFLVDQQVTLPVDGTYVLTVGGQQVGSTGTYSFQLLDVLIDEFAIAFGDTVSDGAPGPGAGNLEAPGAIDIYTFTGTAGVEAIFDHLSGSTTDTFWTLTAPDGAVLFALPVRDHHLALPADGTYTLTVRGDDPDDTGTYSFELRSATPQHFDIAIGDTVSDGVPGPGAGNLEEPGARDIYRFEGSAGQEVSLERLVFEAPNVQWILRGPDGSLVLSGFVSTTVTLPDTGTYTLDLASTTLGTGTYSFRIFDLIDEFVISFGNRVADGVPGPGAGNLEFNESIDVYSFDATAGQVAVFDFVLIDNVESFTVLAPDGSTVVEAVFDGGSGDVDRVEPLNQTGTYTITVQGRRDPSDGTYEFQLLEGTNVDEFTIAFGDQVMDGVPGPGAGNLEAPASADRYFFDAVGGTRASFPTFLGVRTDLRWVLHAPDGSVVFDDAYFGREEDLDQTGTYTLTVLALNRPGLPYVGTYRFGLVNASIDEFAIAYGDSVSDGVPAPGAGNLEVPGARDLYHFEGTAGDVVRIAIDEGAPEVVFSLFGPSGALTGQIAGNLQVALTETGTHTIEVVADSATDSGTYGLRLVLVPDRQEFTITIGDTVSDGVPGAGAGSIEVPGARDVYRFDGNAGQLVAFEVLAVGEPSQQWTLHAPDGSLVFFELLRLSDGEVTLGQDGSYELTVFSADFLGVGLYSFRLTDMTLPTTTTTTTTTTSTTEPETTTSTSEPTTTTSTTTTTTTTTSTTEPTSTSTTEPEPTTTSTSTSTTEPETTTSTSEPTTTTSTTTTTTSEPTSTTSSTTEPPVVTLAVDVDVLPRCIRNDGRGLVPVIIFGSDDVDVRDIDTASVELDGMPVVTVFGIPVTVRVDADRDRLSDLLALIDDVAGAIAPGATSVTLSAELLDGTPVGGSDEICLIER